MFISIPPEMFDPNPVPKLVGARSVCSLRIKRAIGLLRDVKMTRSMMNVSALTAASLIPSTLQASLLFPLAHSFTLLHDTFDWGTDAKSKLKFGVVFASMEQQVLYV